MNKKSLILCFVFTVACTSFAYCDGSEQARSLFYQGNAKYSEEHYEQAIENYEQVLSLGFESGPLYYNLGNSYFKKGYLGKAILNYMRAKKLMPQDADLKSNLAYAQSQIKGGKIAFRRKWFVKTFLNLAGLFSLGALTIAG
ncbi:MAG: tetratricopeptide repeat protein, partial [Candidatus Omnitrophica bacterium]|nr:tetratricopeptide repeat protein [Candidatus Omnitrophota bacterium]